MRSPIKFSCVFLMLIFFASNVLAQYEIEKHYAGPSIGLSFLGSTAQLGLNYEYAFVIKDFGTVGAGGIFRYWGYKDSFFGGSWSYSYILLGGQFNYHFKVNNNKIDPWLGTILALRAGSVKANYSSNIRLEDPSVGGAFIGIQGGARYWFTPTIALIGRAAFGSLSYGGIELGVDFKF